MEESRFSARMQRSIFILTKQNRGPTCSACLELQTTCLEGSKLFILRLYSGSNTPLTFQSIPAHISLSSQSFFNSDISLLSHRCPGARDTLKEHSSLDRTTFFFYLSVKYAIPCAYERNLQAAEHILNSFAPPHTNSVLQFLGKRRSLPSCRMRFFHSISCQVSQQSPPPVYSHFF